jgi:hypothetical protein
VNGPSRRGQGGGKPRGGGERYEAPDPSLHIEFFGMPGVGKSVIAEALVDSLVRRGTKVRSIVAPARAGLTRRLLRVGGRVWRAASALRRPRDFRHQVGLVRGSRQVTPDDFAGVLFNWLVVREHARISRSFPGVFISDQGIVQGVWSILLRSRADRDEALARTLLRGAVLPHVLVVVHADTELTEQRRRERPGVWSRMERLPGVQERGKQLFHRLDRITRSLDAPPWVLDVYNGPDATPDARGEEIVTALSGWLMASGASRPLPPSFPGRGGSSEPDIPPVQ